MYLKKKKVSSFVQRQDKKHKQSKQFHRFPSALCSKNKTCNFYIRPPRKSQQRWGTFSKGLESLNKKQ